MTMVENYTVPGRAVADARPGAVPPWVVAYAHFEGVHLVLHRTGLYWWVCWGGAATLEDDWHHLNADTSCGFDDYEAALAYFRKCEERLLEGRL